mmetsp:Transcript_107061/g.341652  ORF Transcript_107061/g.341652 Transcript_107061/m.341652 type:complete len:269 (-) Transcript_107061:577-1383(-)
MPLLGSVALPVREAAHRNAKQFLVSTALGLPRKYMHLRCACMNNAYHKPWSPQELLGDPFLTHRMHIEPVSWDGDLEVEHVRVHPQTGDQHPSKASQVLCGSGNLFPVGEQNLSRLHVQLASVGHHAPKGQLLDVDDEFQSCCVQDQVGKVIRRYQPARSKPQQQHGDRELRETSEDDDQCPDEVRHAHKVPCVAVGDVVVICPSDSSAHRRDCGYHRILPDGDQRSFDFARASHRPNEKDHEAEARLRQRYLTQFLLPVCLKLHEDL